MCKVLLFSITYLLFGGEHTQIDLENDEIWANEIKVKYKIEEIEKRSNR